MFDLSPIVRDENELIRTKDIIRNNFRMFHINFIEKMINEFGLESYPKMSYDTVMSYAQYDRGDN